MVDADGFSVRGEASDNVRIDRVVATVTDPVRGVSPLATSYDAGRGEWTATVSAAMVSAGRTADIAAVAYDAAQNRATAVASVQVITDAAPPRVTVSAPQSGAAVPRSGFLVSGIASDDIGVVSLVATVDDPVLGRTVDQSLGVAAGGGWSFAVLSGQVSEGRTATLTLVARDAKNKTGSTTLQVQVVGVDYFAHHVINRLTFGSSPELLAAVQASGVDAFVDQQLAPQSIDDSALAALLPAAPTSKAELQRQAVQRMIYSRRQLLEVLTQFWDNHFNTDANKTLVVAYEVNEHALFRQRALGRFRDLLDASAKSPAMLIYLDQAASRRGQPNENYPRELMELHTLGVDGGYTQTDVEQVARAFTGWTVSNGQFVFDGNTHDATQKIVLGQTLPAGRGIEDGEQVLDILAAHPSTARFICTKLAQLLVGDTPPQSVVGRCAAEYLATGGQIGLVVRILVRSPEFAEPSSTYGRQLRQVAQLIKSGVGLELAALSIGGWDTHNNQGGGESAGQQARRHQDFAAGIAALCTDLGPSAMRDVTVLTMTEFGRTAADNGNGGTDHGHAAAWFVAGGSVRGGIYGTWPGLSAPALVRGRYLNHSVDFRNVMGDVLVHHLGNPDVADVLPGFTYQPVGLI